MKSNKYDISTLITKFLNENISEEENAFLKDWLAENSSNQQFFDELVQTDKIQRGIKLLENIDYDKGWKAVITKQRKPRAKTLNYIYRAAAVILAVLAISFFFLDNTSDNKRVVTSRAPKKIDLLPAESAAQLQLADGSILNLDNQSFSIEELNGVEVESQNGQLVYTNKDFTPFNTKLIYNILSVPKKGFYKVTLSDGTNVWVNSDSKLSYPVKFNATNRIVKLSGEAYFEVSHDSARPFSVEVADGTIRVLGTKFNVNTYKNQSTTTLLEGSVIVQVSNKQKKLVPGQKALIKSDDIDVSDADIQKDMAWKNGKFVFRKETIDDVMDEVARWYNIEVEYKGKDLDKRFTGDISRSLELPEVLEMLRFLSDYDFVLDERVVTVYKKNHQQINKSKAM